jgi:hypothetical protein
MTYRVDVYFNLRTRLWSIRHKGKVIAHARYVVLRDAVGVVSEKGRQRVIAKQCRSVHAVIRGTLDSYSDVIPSDLEGRAVSYNPYRAPTFYHCDDRTPWNGASLVRFGNAVAIV